MGRWSERDAKMTAACTDGRGEADDEGGLAHSCERAGVPAAKPERNGRQRTKRVEREEGGM